MTTATLPPSAVWTDKKRYFWPLGALAVSLPLIGYAAALATGWAVFWWTLPIFLYGIIPALDYLVGEDTENPPAERMASLAQEKSYRYAVLLAVPCKWSVFFWGCSMPVTGGLNCL